MRGPFQHGNDMVGCLVSVILPPAMRESSRGDLQETLQGVAGSCSLGNPARAVGIRIGSVYSTSEYREPHKSVISGCLLTGQQRVLESQAEEKTQEGKDSNAFEG